MIIKPYITEKTLREAKDGVFTFRIDKTVNKIVASTALQKLHKVKVLAAKVINVKPSPIRFKGKSGHRQGFKKLLVRISKGQKIPGFEIVEKSKTKDN